MFAVSAEMEGRVCVAGLEDCGTFVLSAASHGRRLVLSIVWRLL